jgi:Signal transduction histidine kinase
MNKKEKKQKSPSGKAAKFMAKREPVVVITAITLAFLVLFAIFALLCSSMLDSEKLSLENQVERTFNNIFWDLEEGAYQFDQLAQEDNKIISIGIYSSVGELQYAWGKVYNRIAVSSLVQDIIASGGDSKMVYDSKSGTMEYTRFLRRRVVLSSSNILSINPTIGINSPGIQFPSILYLAFDGSGYVKRVRLIKLVSFLLCAFFCAVYVFVIRLYLDNRGYREKMIKNESLVNIGSAARTLTHEIKNPLSAITLQLALMKRELVGDQLEDLMVIDHETKRLVALTNRVSDFLKNPVGKPEPIDIYLLIDSLLPLFSYSVTIPSTSLGQAIVMFDPDRARSVFENILKNAMESCEGRDPMVEAEITLDKKNIFHFFIRDRGDGIKELDMEKLFDPFYTTKIHGSGIGLAISRQFLQAQKGDIRIYPRDGGGTVVEVILPRYSLLSELVGISHPDRRGE